MVVIEAVFLTILFSGLDSLNGTGFSPCSEPGRAAATLCDAMVGLIAHRYFPTLCCAVWAQQLLPPGSLLAVLLAGKVLLLALHSLSHSVVEVVVAWLKWTYLLLSTEYTITRSFRLVFETML